MQLVEIYPKNIPWSPFWRTLYFWHVRARCQKSNWIQHSHQRALSHLHNHRDTAQQLQQQHHHNRYPHLNCLKCQHNLQQCGESASHSPHHLAILRKPTPPSTTQDVNPTLPITSWYCLGSRSFKMTKKKSPRLLEKKDTPAIPHNAGGRRQSREGGLITGWMNNCKRGAPLKITPTNKKMKGNGK